MEPDANPLQEWLVSCQQLKALLGDNVLILPSHGMPFYGAKLRLQALIDEHQRDLDQLVQFCREPRRVTDAFPVLFKADINQHNRVMACGESRAHFNCLLSRGQLPVTTDDKGVLWFQQINS